MARRRKYKSNGFGGIAWLLAGAGVVAYALLKLRERDAAVSSTGPAANVPAKVLPPQGRPPTPASTGGKLAKPPDELSLEGY